MTPKGAPVGPYRVQRKRTKGWRMPENTVYVGRPSPWGNPWALDDAELDGHPRPDGTPWDAADLVRWFRDYTREVLSHHPEWLAPLRGKALACWCDLSEPCHADVLLELANA